MKKTPNIIAIIIIIAVILTCGYFLYVHRNVIRAWLNGEDDFELPEGHPRCCWLHRD